MKTFRSTTLWIFAMLVGTCLSQLRPSTCAAEQSGDGTAVMHQLAVGVAPYAGTQIPFLFVRVESPTSPSELGGSALVFVPIISIVHEGSTPKVAISDPVSGGDGLCVTIDGQKVRILEAKKLAQAVQDGSVPPDVPVNVTFTIQLHDGIAVKTAVFEALRSQLRKLEDESIKVGSEWTSDDWKRMQNSIYMIPPRELAVVCKSPGLEDVRTDIKNSPNLSNSLVVQMKVPTLFVSQVFSTAGANIGLEFGFDVYGEKGATVSSKQIASSLVSTLLADHGKGGSKVRVDTPETNMEFLVTSQRMEELSNDLKAGRKVIIRGSSSEDLSFLANLLQRDDLDVIAAEANEVEEFFKRNYAFEEWLRKPGTISMLEGLKNNQDYTDEEYEHFISDFESSGKRSQGGGGLSLGLFSIGGGGGGEKQNTKAHKEQRREAIKQFMSNLNHYRAQGSFPAHVSRDYRLCSQARFEKAFDQFYKLQRAGVVQHAIRSTFCNSSINVPTRTPSNTLLEIRKALEDAQAAKVQTAPKKSEE